ncbi:ectopic P granules protein 5 homolog isoform X2 [Eupeodes corollae]|uniref:ectopic P granules protein 5 homolog isoform X2 n=1 Tax=Eupeodes corollae TaxID=290404 RepID=UPI00249375BF|nr:ectopic P granules protein 5 homolog isoform X2 [Eupeodes corollae]
MATMERPKVQKKKKTKKTTIKEEKLLTDSEAEDDTASASTSTSTKNTKINDDVQSLDIDFPTTKCDDIVSHECFVSTNFQPFDKISLDDEDLLSDDDKENQKQKPQQEEEIPTIIPQVEEPKEESTPEVSIPVSIPCAPSIETEDQMPFGTPLPWTQNFEEPTAPVFCESKTATKFDFKPATSVKYPDLSSMSRVQTHPEVFYQTYKPSSSASAISRLKPFTTEQLREIYYCQDIEMVKQFELEFLMNSLLENTDSDPFYVLLLKYLNLQGKLVMNQSDLAEKRKRFNESKDDIWTIIERSATGKGVCGDGNTVSYTKIHEVAVINETQLALSVDALNQITQLLCYSYSVNLIEANLTKIKIDKIINEIMSYDSVRGITNESPVSLNKNLSTITLHCINRLRRAITILFSFIRKPSPNETFTKSIKNWLSTLISLHIRIGTREDHWFLLFHILRCPNGVGNWGKSFIQLPLTDSTKNNEHITLSSAEMNHCVAILHILLLPIKKRNDFLKAFSQEISDPVKEDHWILIESDGEEGTTSNGECIGLRESDLIALLDQMPFEMLFCYALNVDKTSNNYNLEADLITGNQVLKVIAFFSTLIEIFGEGMITYNRERYKQLAKRLGRLIRHVLQYVSDYYELFIRNNLSKDPYLCERINVELNSLLIKACSYIYRTRNLATWQYFSSLPYNSLDASTVWQLFFYLNVGFPTQFPAPHEDYIARYHATDFWNYFNGANADSSAEDLYYLLQTFFEMANERDRVKDWELIQAICLHIFDIGFINEKTRDICYKTSRDMLVNLTLAYNDLMSSLLLQVKIRFEEIENAAYLFQSLPLENWKPEMDSFETLSSWLLHFDYKTKENILARIIVSHLNWGFDCDNRLYLPHNIHVRMACLVSEALTKHAPEIVGQSGISESVRQVSDIESQSSKEQFTTWCWTMVSVLRLHLMDQSFDSIKNTLQNPTEPLMFIPDLEKIEVIYQGVTENRPLSMYVAILVSLWGHSVPLICQKGFEQLKLLLSDYRHAAVIRCIELIVPLFMETPETLAKCEGFQTILTQLLNADKTYLKMAKEMLFSSSLGPVMELLDNMIQHQVISYYNYGLTTPLMLVNTWLHVLTNVPNWQNTMVLHLIEKILAVAYQFPDVWMASKEYFRYYYRDCDDWKGHKISTLKFILGTSNQSRVPNIIVTNYGWFALLLLDIEFELQDTQIWSEFLRQLSAVKNNTKINIDNVVKKTSSILKFPIFTAQNLVVYKYANIISTLDVNHPAFPLLVQQFFVLFLARVPFDPDEERFQYTFGVSDKLYEFNVTLMKKIKTNLKAAESLYLEKVVEDKEMAYFYNNCSKIMKTYSLWLEETTINVIAKDQQSLPPQYNPEKLNEILSGSTQHWTELVFLPKLRKSQKHQSIQWCRKILRSKSTKNLRSALQPKPTTTPLERIKIHLKSYDKRLAGPALILKQNSVPNQQRIDLETLIDLRNNLKVLESSAKIFNLHSCELNGITKQFNELVMKLYKNVSAQEEKQIQCSSLVLNSKCKRAGSVKVQYQVPIKQSVIDRQMTANTNRFTQLIEEFLSQNMDQLARAVDTMESVIRFMVSSQVESGCVRQYSKDVTTVGIQFFYDLVKAKNEVMTKFPPGNDLCNNILTELGVFIQDNLEKEGLRILELALQRPDLLKIISNLFEPYRTGPLHFIGMYKFLIDAYLKDCDKKVLFVLLSKFDLPSWLETFRPKLADINRLLKLVLSGLKSWNKSKAEILQDQFRRHLVLIFDHEFPEHYGEVIQLVLDGISEQELMPVVLLDLLNSLLQQCNCDQLALDSSNETIKSVCAEFSRRQNLFSLKGATDTVKLFATHFEKERWHSGIDGLYPKHREYCKPLAMWFSCLSHVVVTTAIVGYPGLLADQISECIFAALIEMYVPWLIPYSEEKVSQLAPNWIRQHIGDTKVLYPWTAVHGETSMIIINSFIHSIIFALESLPVSQAILGHTFSFYIHHYAVEEMQLHVRKPIHNGIIKLPWELFKPLPTHIHLLYDSLKVYVPESHALLGYIFLRIDWNKWIRENFSSWPPAIQTQVCSRLLSIFVKMSFEPNIHVHTSTSKILEDAIAYPWYMVEYQELENLFTWVLKTVEPSILLKLPSESNYADRAALDLLSVSSAMMPEKAAVGPITHATAKRILYARFIVKLLRMCATKHNKLVATKDGFKAFSTALQELMDLMERSVVIFCTTKKERDQEALNLMIEIIVSMQSHNQETSKFFIDILIDWQSRCKPGSTLLCQTLNAFGHSKAFIAGIYILLESTIVNYFRISDGNKEDHYPSWMLLLKSLQFSYDKLEVMPFLRGQNFLSLHAYIIYKMQNLTDAGQKISFLQDLSQLLEHVKTNATTEPRMAIVWGAIVTSGCKILSESEATSDAKKPLLMLARHFHVLSTQSEGWGEGLLGVIGFKKDSISNRRKVLTRCISCIVFSLFPDTSSDTILLNQEFVRSFSEMKMLIANKKFNDVKMLVVKAIELIDENKFVDVENVPELIYRVIRLFYSDTFLETVPEVWSFEFKWP